MAAAELIHSWTDSAKLYIGLTTWHGVKVRKQNVGIAKNYPNEKRLLALNNLVKHYLLVVERQARLRKPMPMTNWITKLDMFFMLNEGNNILIHTGSISHELTTAHAEHEYDTFHRQRQLNSWENESYFDNAVKLLTDGKNETNRIG